MLAADGPAIEDPNVPYENLSWRVRLLQYLGEYELYSRFQFTEPWDRELNKQVEQELPSVYGTNDDGTAFNHMMAGGHAMFATGRGTRITEFRDGTANTLLVVVAGDDKAETWTKPSGLAYKADSPADPETVLGSPLTSTEWQYVHLYHSGCVEVGVMPPDIDKEQFQTLCGKDEGIRSNEDVVRMAKVTSWRNHHGHEAGIVDKIP